MNTAAPLRALSPLACAALLGQAALALPAAAAPAPEPADLVVLDARITTEDPAQPEARALAARAGRLVYVGDDAGARGFVGPHTRVLPLAGRRVLPGLIDAHIHPLSIVEGDVCDLKNEPRSLAQIGALVRECVRRYRVPPGQWLAVHAWNYSNGNQVDAAHPDLRHALDRGAADRPVVLFGSDGHHGAFNSAALARARNARGETVGLNRATLAGEFAGQRALVGVDAQGEPDGSVNEDARLLLGGPDDLVDMTQVMKAPQRVMARLNASGITAVQDAYVRTDMLPAYDTLQARGQLTVRANLVQYLVPEAYRGPDGAIDYEALLAQARATRARYEGNPLLRADAVKFFADGVLEGNPLAVPPTPPEAPALHPYLSPRFARGADGRARLLGYVDTEGTPCRQWRELAPEARTAPALERFGRDNGFHPDQCQRGSGVLQHEPQVLEQAVTRLHREGFMIHIHAIGDRAVRAAVDSIEAARRADGRADRPDTIAHAQLVAPEDVQRIGHDHIAVAMTFAWATTDPEYDLAVIPFIDRVADGSYAALHQADNYYERNAYPTRALKDAGALVVAGSDAPVDTPDPRPFVNLQMAVTRAVAGRPALNPAQSLQLSEAVDAYTLSAARALDRESEIGSLQIGKSADFIVLDRDIFTVPIDRVGRTRVLQTWFQGRRVYAAGPG
jgi:predicted amidohydrolase YtcJ